MFAALQNIDNAQTVNRWQKGVRVGGIWKWAAMNSNHLVVLQVGPGVKGKQRTRSLIAGLLLCVATPFQLCSILNCSTGDHGDDDKLTWTPNEPREHFDHSAQRKFFGSDLWWSLFDPCRTCCPLVYLRESVREETRVAPLHPLDRLTFKSMLQICWLTLPRSQMLHALRKYVIYGWPLQYFQCNVFDRKISSQASKLC